MTIDYYVDLIFKLVVVALLTVITAANVGLVLYVLSILLRVPPGMGG